MSRLVHGRFTPLADKIAMVRAWPGINPADVDAALVTATKNGTIAGYESEVADNTLLDIVITVYRESFFATFMYARERMKNAWGERYSEWSLAYGDDIEPSRIEALPGTQEFIPNRIVIEVIDFGTNWHGRDVPFWWVGVIQAHQAPKLAGFGVIYNAAQSPEWVKSMNGTDVPYALAGALILNNVWGYEPRMHTPRIAYYRAPRVACRDEKSGAILHGRNVENYFAQGSLPMFRRYERQGTSKL